MTIVYIIIAYLSGTVLYAPIWGWLFGRQDIRAGSSDHNPGTANAYKNGGFWCGTMTLLCDLGKGFLPVYYCFHGGKVAGVAAALVLAAPVFGHVLPAYAPSKGGKGIATTFGCLLGLIPNWRPAIVLAFFFILYSVVICVSPHTTRTIVTYLSVVIAFGMEDIDRAVQVGFLLITVLVGAKIMTSKEEKEKSSVRFLWRH